MDVMLGIVKGHCNSLFDQLRKLNYSGVILATFVNNPNFQGSISEINSVESVSDTKVTVTMVTDSLT